MDSQVRISGVVVCSGMVGGGAGSDERTQIVSVYLVEVVKVEGAQRVVGHVQEVQIGQILGGE